MHKNTHMPTIHAFSAYSGGLQPRPHHRSIRVEGQQAWREKQLEVGQVRVRDERKNTIDS